MDTAGSNSQIAEHALSDYSDVERMAVPLGTYVSLYAGAGGLDIGFALAGFKPVWVSELDVDALATHHATFEMLSRELPHLKNLEYASRGGDLLALADKELPARGTADLVIGGPPCQGFSVAGKMNPEDERSKHVFHFMDVVERVEPRAFVLENVKALYANQKWSDVRDALRKRADNLGYNAEIYLTNASHFGVPQARERMFFIGIRKELGVPLPPEPTTLADVPTVRQALSQLPPYNSPGNDFRCTARITTAKTPVLRRSPFAGMLFNGAGRPLNLDAPSSTLAASMGGNKTPIIDQRLLEKHESESWVVKYHADLWQNKGATVVSEVPDYLRRLTVQEASAIQTFPLNTPWQGPQSAKFRQIGNAVPPRLALAVARAVRNALSV